MSGHSSGRDPASRIVFVVPVLDRAEALRRCLAAIRRTRVDPPARIVVVDGGSRDASRQVAESAGAEVVAAGRQTIAELRNRGAARAGGEVIAFVDSDVEPDPAWPDAALSVLDADPGVAAVGGPKILPEGSGWVRRACWMLQGFPAGASAVRWLRGGCLAVRRRSFDQVGGFDAELETCEDQDLSLRLRSAGSELRSDSRLRWHHHGEPETLRRLFRGELWRGRDNLRASLKSARSARELLSVAYPIVQLVLVAGGIAAAVLWPSGRWVALAGLSSLLGLALVRAARAWRHAAERPVGFAALFLVSFVHDVARALAIVLRARYPRGRSS